MDAETAAVLAKLLRKERIAHLATLRAGAPMASMTLYLPEEDFSAFYVHVSRLAWHTQDMLQDPRVALSIAEADDGRADPFTLTRVSIRGDASQLARDNPALKARWGYYVVYPAHKRLKPAARAFVDWLLALPQQP